MKNLIFVTMMIAMTLGLASCEKDIYADAWDNGGTTPDPTYELTTDHISAELAGNKILDDHKAILKKDGQAIEEHTYTATHEIRTNKVTLKRAIAEELQNSTISYVDDKFDLAGTMMVATVTLQNCDKVYFNENGKTYCHSKFVEDGAVAALTCCTPQPSVLKVKNLNGNILYADMVISDRESIEYPVEIIVTDDDVRTVDYSDATVISADEVELIKTVKVNGSVVENSPIRVAYHATLECGEMVTTNDLTQLAYGANANVSNGTAMISMNIVSFTASVDMPTTVTFVDEGSTHTAKVVYNSLYVTSNGDIKVVDNSAENIDIMNTCFFKLVCDGIDMAADTKEIRQTLRVYAEFEKEENGIVYIILHEKEDIRFTAPSGISLVAGEDQTKIAETLELSSHVNNPGNWTATKTSTVNNVKFTSFSRQDVFYYTNGISNTVKVIKNDNFVVVYNGHEYGVEMSEVAVSGAAPVAGNVTTDNVYKTRPYTLVYTASRNAVKSSDETVITLKKAVVPYTIEGYKLVRADQTDRYDSNRKIWNATPICAWFESLSDKNNTLFVAYDETTGAEIYRENTSSKTLPAMPLAMVFDMNTKSFVGGSVLIEENAYSYYSFDKSIFTAVSSVSTATSEEIRRSPYRGSGSYSIEDETTSFDLENGSKLILK